MKSQNKKIKVGKVLDAHGLRGDVYCLLFSGDASWIDELESLSLDRGGVLADFKIEKIKAFKKGFIAKLSSFNDRNRAEEFKGAELWVDEELFVAEEGESFFLREILGFAVEDKNSGEIGLISGFSSNGNQDLLVIEKNEKSVEIPFVKEFVVHMDYAQRRILMELPEGLLEINDAD